MALALAQLGPLVAQIMRAVWTGSIGEPFPVRGAHELAADPPHAGALRGRRPRGLRGRASRDQAVIATIPVGITPVGPWQANNGFVYVDDETSQQVTVISAGRAA